MECLKDQAMINKDWRKTNPHYMNDPKFQRTLKITELKTLIKNVQLEMQDIIANLNPEEEAKLPEEEQKKRKEEFRDNIQLKRATIQGFRDELKKVVDNKKNSSGFEVIEKHTGMNRQQARNFRRQRRYNRSK